MKKSLFVASIVALFVSCASQPSKELKTSIDTLIGNYVSEGYEQRSNGYDWIGVSVTQQSDSTAQISVRARADIKQPTCRFDAMATLAGQDTLKAVYEGENILFIFTGNQLTITTEKQEERNLLFYFCSGGASLAGTYTRIEGALDESQIDRRTYSQLLSLQGFSFDITAANNELTIQPIGLKIDNHAVKHDLTGYTVTNAEIGDLNADGSPELFVYLTSVGSGSYGSVIGYSVNNGKSMSQINFPGMADQAEANKGYMGHDEFAIVELSFCQRFPIYKEKDCNANPTGGMRQIQYKLIDGEACRQLVVDKVIEF